MFNNQRYITVGIKEKIPYDTQLILWKLIDDLEYKKDYLQIFKFIPIDRYSTELIHLQEQPMYEKSYSLSISMSKCKVYAIDDGINSTLMLAEEY